VDNSVAAADIAAAAGIAVPVVLVRLAIQVPLAAALLPVPALVLAREEPQAPAPRQLAE